MEDSKNPCSEPLTEEDVKWLNQKNAPLIYDSMPKLVYLSFQEGVISLDFLLSTYENGFIKALSTIIEKYDKKKISTELETNILLYLLDFIKITGDIRLLKVLGDCLDNASGKTKGLLLQTIQQSQPAKDLQEHEDFRAALYFSLFKHKELHEYRETLLQDVVFSKSLHTTWVVKSDDMLEIDDAIDFCSKATWMSGVYPILFFETIAKNYPKKAKRMAEKALVIAKKLPKIDPLSIKSFDTQWQLKVFNIVLKNTTPLESSVSGALEKIVDEMKVDVNANVQTFFELVKNIVEKDKQQIPCILKTSNDFVNRALYHKSKLNKGDASFLYYLLLLGNRLNPFTSYDNTISTAMRAPFGKDRINAIKCIVEKHIDKNSLYSLVNYYRPSNKFHPVLIAHFVEYYWTNMKRANDLSHLSELQKVIEHNNLKHIFDQDSVYQLNIKKLQDKEKEQQQEEKDSSERYNTLVQRLS